MKQENEGNKAMSEDKVTAPKAEANKPKFKKEELLAIFDEIIFSGEYIEEVAIKGKLKVKFRSRSAEDTLSISQDIDSKNFTLMTTLSEYRALQNLGYSLVSYAGNDLSKMEVKERVKFVSKLLSPVVAALSQALVDFDEKVNAACMEGEANF